MEIYKGKIEVQVDWSKPEAANYSSRIIKVFDRGFRQTLSHHNLHSSAKLLEEFLFEKTKVIKQISSLNPLLL